MMRKSIVCIAFVFASQMFAEIQNDNFESEKVYRFEEIESTKDDLQIQGNSQAPTK